MQYYRQAIKLKTCVMVHYIEITSTCVAAKTFRYDGWEPSAWNLSALEPGLNMDLAMELDTLSGIEG